MNLHEELSQAIAEVAKQAGVFSVSSCDPVTALRMIALSMQSAREYEAKKLAEAVAEVASAVGIVSIDSDNPFAALHSIATHVKARERFKDTIKEGKIKLL